ncbi:unnamed protein product [Fusarium graminearum]|uniref:Chromosome 4, complete genome n=2 Tax=Gibberella zeae TaxID=5518 RepID=I1S8A5_GIBZE|nr:hypothetical protein FGSG_13083 [Fusarium graminearum PH-1]EYB26641.1 hypothetical protein FG05_13083 [Fusarium graminearum]ESU13389.1 hypothetical protein FGSG_13083 [Fusarium graminearum PH-1]CAF3443711.1 unnamed protein product [Fusarium graminearum]CAF3461799.1 unnamed protein product [Fusarium graminearum]CAF3616108.1 unnamed protein product [Fusarium graminearum]|eukprot:XP_011326896.1 hypothetical protein FGSG_13083 [Fusarium graminearum PH-1]
MQPLPQCLETTTHLRWKSCGDSLFATRGSVSEASLIQMQQHMGQGEFQMFESSIVGIDTGLVVNIWIS